MTKGAKQTAALAQLRALADRPADQVQYALDLLAGERSVRVVPEALDVVAAAEVPAARPVLLDLYEYYDADGVKRDPGCQIRSRILQALLPISVAPDAALAERALTTYEFLPPTRAESAGGLRAAGLALLAEWDPGPATYHAVRLLTDPHTARMSGEPAVTAARLLGGQGELLPLYGYVLDLAHAISEVWAECLRHLAGTPAAVLTDLLARYGATDDEFVLIGVLDLLLAHEARASQRAFLTDFLRTTRRYAVYRYLVTSIVARRAPEEQALLLDVAAEERDPRKTELLLEALALAPPDPAVAKAIAGLERRR
jgi:hypothetical protein